MLKWNSKKKTDFQHFSVCMKEKYFGDRHFQETSFKIINKIHSKITMAGDVVSYYTVTALKYLHWSNSAASLN